MTTQDKTVPKLAIKLGYGFPANKDTQKHLYPKDILTIFLNVNPKNEDEVINFCNKYTYIPRSLEHGPVLGFIADQKELADIALKITKETLSDDDVNKINRYLEAVHPKITIIDNHKVHEFNKELGVDTLPHVTKKYLLENVIFGSTFVKLCAELMKRTIEKQDLKQCLNCGKFMLSNPRKPRKFCNNNNLCKLAHKQRRLRHKRKNISNTPVRTLF